MSTRQSYISEILELTDYMEVAYRRTDMEGGIGEIWDITLADEQSTVRICDDDGTIRVYLFTGGRAQINSGEATFARHLAAPGFVAMVIDQLVADQM